jgi:hypothetical protein
MNKDLVINTKVIEEAESHLLDLIRQNEVDVETDTYIPPEDFDINDYEPACKDDNLVEMSLLNVFICYYKQLYQVKQENHMFDGIDSEKEDSTNRCIELMYEEIHKFQKSTDDDKDILFDPDDNTVNIDLCIELYVLYVDGNVKYVSKYMLPLLRYISDLDWATIEWSVIKIKG